MYEVIQGDSGWVLQVGRTPLVAFPSRIEAVRAGIAVCRDEGLGRLVIRWSDGAVEELDPLVQPLDALEV